MVYHGFTVLPVSSRTYQLLPSQWWLIPWFWTPFSAARWSSIGDNSPRKQNICLNWACFSPPAPVALLCDSSPRPPADITNDGQKLFCLKMCTLVASNVFFFRKIQWFVYNESSIWRVHPKLPNTLSCEAMSKNFGQVLENKENTARHGTIQARNYTSDLHVSDGIYQPKWCSRGHMDGIAIGYAKLNTLM